MAYNKTNPLEGFTFRKVAYGVYLVTYASDYDRKIGRHWAARIHDMTIIDSTHNADTPKRRDVELLRMMVKRDGVMIERDGRTAR